MLSRLSNDSLLEAHKSAVLLNLDKDFICILENEILTRGLIPKKKAVQK